MTESEGLPGIEPTAQLLILAAARLTRLHGRVLSRLAIPLTYRQHRILVRVSEGHTSLAALAAFGNLTLPTVSESVEVLVRRGLLTRTARAGDRRARPLGLTPQGRSACAAGQKALGAAAEGLISELPEKHKRVLHESLTTIFDAATAHFQAELSKAPAEDKRSMAGSAAEPAQRFTRSRKKNT